MDELTDLRVKLLSDFFLFTRFFFKERTGRDFIVSRPASNKSHFIEIADEFTKVFTLKTNSLALNCPPGWSKTEMCKSFVCWSLAHYPDSRFLYISYSHDLAAAHTYSIRETISLPMYRRLFGVEIKRDSSAKDFFQTNSGGAVAAFGSTGAITGRDAGLPGLDRFSGAAILDDITKPDEVHSDIIRDKVKRNYEETILMRLRSSNVPIILIGQRLHEDDIFGYLAQGNDGRDWKRVIIKALDDAGNARYPEVLPRSQLLIKREKQPYVFASQYQQDPIPAGGALFKEDYFPLLDSTPEILGTFVTADTAETEKEWNDKTVFSFWGLYKIKIKNVDVPDLFGLHWLDCREINIEPKDLEDEFLDFWASCMRYKIKPQLAIIEKKSTGVTLISVLKRVQGIKVLGIERTVKSGSKTQRFIDMQQYIANKQISLPLDAKHTKMCIDHMMHITANGTHRFDDIADTCYDAIRAAFIDKIIVAKIDTNKNYDDIATNMMQGQHHLNNLRNKAYGSSSLSRPIR